MALARHHRRWQAVEVLADPLGNHSWVFDLIATDDVLRRRALARHQALLVAAREALRWSNRVWAQAGTPAPAEPHLAAEMDQARASFRWNEEQTIFGPIHAFLSSRGSEAGLPSPPYAVLYLRWETDYPQEWAAPGSCIGSPWGTKEVLLRRFDREGVPESVCSQIADLAVCALQRPYRCKDWMYARLVRQIADTTFLERIEALHDADDLLVRLRAQFISHVARHPELPVKRVSWQRWLSTTDEES
jgi:hypothetical protein